MTTTVPTTVQERIALPVPHAAPSGAGAGMTVSDVLRVLKQRLFLILFVWLFVAGSVFALWYLLWTKFPGYTAAALIQVESPIPNAPLQWGQIQATKDLMNRWLQDEATLVKTDEVLRMALTDPEVQKTAWYHSVPEDERLEELREDLHCWPIPETSYLRVSMTCRSKKDPHRIINTVVNKYLNRREELFRSQYRAEIANYQAQLEDLESLLQDKEQAIRRAREAIPEPGTLMGMNPIAQRLAGLYTQLAAAESEKLRLKALYESYTSVRPEEIAVSPEMQQLVESDPQIMRLQADLQSLEQALESLEAQGTIGQRHRDYQAIRARRDVIEAQLRQLRETRLNDVKRFQIEQTRMAYYSAIDAEAEILEKIEQEKAAQRDLDKKVALYEALLEERRLLEDRRNRIRGYLDDLRLLVAQEKPIKIRLASQASEPLDRSSPRPEVYWPAGVALGLLLAVGLAFALEFLDTSVRTPRDLVRHVNLPVLGTVPDVDDEEVAIEQVETAVQTEPQSMIAEAFRTIRANLAFSAPPERQRTILITSPRPEDGKTTVAINLASSISQGGRRVLLIDANFRRPSLHRFFAAAGPAGLSNVLIGQASLEERIAPSGFPNLDVLASGPVPPNPAELLGSTYMRQLLAEATDKYDQVIVDGPPVLLVSESLLLATIVDGVVMVCRAGANSRGVAQRCRDFLQRVNAHIFGAVLNAAQARRGGYFREQFRAFYEYQPEEAPPPPPTLPAQDTLSRT